MRRPWLFLIGVAGLTFVGITLRVSGACVFSTHSTAGGDARTSTHAGIQSRLAQKENSQEEDPNQDTVGFMSTTAVGLGHLDCVELRPGHLYLLSVEHEAAPWSSTLRRAADETERQLGIPGALYRVRVMGMVETSAKRDRGPGLSEVLVRQDPHLVVGAVEGRFETLAHFRPRVGNACAVVGGWLTLPPIDRVDDSLRVLAVQHELGHTLGLDHDVLPTSIMYPDVALDWRLDPTARRLTSADIARLRRYLP